ncbi:sporulation-delaying protein SdpB family protein [Actinokineospora sp. HUAS TT18]|uniref:sporulation-delaying protein SdpB family protein n=1 Tax=Actinokineospora sp. HUAS TT18 TaxID=3447451 RepID=UPI003F5259E4
MPALAGVRRRVLADAARFDPRTRWYAVGRSMLALATLSIVVATPDSALFPYLTAQPEGPRCDGLRSLSLWCVGGGSPAALTIARVVTVLVLVLVAAGYRPRWTCVPHWYATVSVGVSVYVPNGGDRAAQVATLLLIPLCIGDHRRWHWTTPTAPPPPWSGGSAYAAHLALRLQVAIIYGHAAVAKLTEAIWRDGTAVHYAMQDAYFGAPDGLLRLVESVPGLVFALTWGAIALEVVIAVAVLGGPRTRTVALTCGVALHTAFAAAFGLISFALVMISVLTIVRSRSR